MAIRLVLLSNAGGSGKTTIAVHLAYLLGNAGFSVALVDLDPQGSCSLMGGLPRPHPDEAYSIIIINKS
jgi:chromosome partitioning protein